MFKEFISYIKNPQEGAAYTFKPKSLLSSFTLYIVVVLGITILAALIIFILSRSFPELMSPKVVSVSDAPIWIVALLGPLVEEGAFRLSLNRKRIFCIISLVLLSFMLISSFCFSRRIYTADHLAIRIGMALAAGGLLYLLLGKLMMKCKFKPYFWFWAVLFGCLHLMNAKFSSYLPLDFITLLLYTFTRVVMGLALGYIRMKNSFATSTALHILNNLITFI